MLMRTQRWLATVITLATLVAVPTACGAGSVGDMAMDRSFQGGEARPVHPPRGERKKVPRKGAMSMQSEPIECFGGEVVQANIEIHVSAAQGALVRKGCRLRLVNVDLVANDGAVVEGGQLTMVNGSIKAKGAAIRATGEAVVELTGVDVRGATGIEASDRARVTTDGGRVAGSGAALAVREQAQVALMGTPLDGPIARDETARVTVVDAPEAAKAVESGGLTKPDPPQTTPGATGG